jgi:hypothetical protein
LVRKEITVCNLSALYCKLYNKGLNGKEIFGQSDIKQIYINLGFIWFPKEITTCLKKNTELCNVSFCGNIHLRKYLTLHKTIAHSQDTKTRKCRDFEVCQFAISENLLKTCKFKYSIIF